MLADVVKDNILFGSPMEESDVMQQLAENP